MKIVPAVPVVLLTWTCLRIVCRLGLCVLASLHLFLHVQNLFKFRPYVTQLIESQSGFLGHGIEFVLGGVHQQPPDLKPMENPFCCVSQQKMLVMDVMQTPFLKHHQDKLKEGSNECKGFPTNMASECVSSQMALYIWWSCAILRWSIKRN